MAERSQRQNEIVAEMMQKAIVSAREFERDCEAFSERQKIDEMVDVIEEFAEWVEERDADRLEELGISMEEAVDGRLLFRVEELEEPFVVRPRADMTIAAGGKIIQLNPDLPILEDDVYVEVLDRIISWAADPGSKTQRPFG